MSPGDEWEMGPGDILSDLKAAVEYVEESVGEALEPRPEVFTREELRWLLRQGAGPVLGLNEAEVADLVEELKP